MITDEEMIFDALRRYAAWRHKFAADIQRADFMKEDGTKPNTEEVAFAVQLSAQANRLASYAKEKVDSPIIQLQ